MVLFYMAIALKHKVLHDTIIKEDVTIKTPVPIEYSPDASGRKGLLTCNMESNNDVRSDVIHQFHNCLLEHIHQYDYIDSLNE